MNWGTFSAAIVGRTQKAVGPTALLCHMKSVRQKLKPWHTLLHRDAEYLSELIKQVDFRQVSLYAIFEAANRVETRMSEG